MSPSNGFPELSIVVPARDEEPNLAPLVAEVEERVRGAGVDAELIVVDDGSVDGTPAALATLVARTPWLVALRLDAPSGISAALRAGCVRARAPYVGMLDADLQNDPGDLPALLALVHGRVADLAQGVRAVRRDTWLRRAESAVGRGARRILLGDPTRDTGCTTRVLTASLARRLPLELEGLHRFIPYVARRLGARVLEVPVSHRPRRAGVSKVAPFGRGPRGLVDCLALRWLLARRREPAVSDLG